MNKNLDEYKNTRKKYVDDFVASVYGHDWLEFREIQLNFDPHNQYVSGVLYPQETLHDSEEFGSHEDEGILGEVLDSEQETLLQKTHSSDKKANSDSEDEGEEDELNVISLSSQSRQSAFGLTFISEINSNLQVTFGYSMYEREILPKGENSRQRYQWKRVQIIEKLAFNNIQGTTEERINKDMVQVSIKSRKFKKI